MERVTLAEYGPELIICLFGLLCLGAGMFRSRQADAAAKWLALVGLLITAVYAGFAGAYRGEASQAGGLHPLLGYVRLLTVSIGLLAVLVSWRLPAPGRIPEMFALMLFSILGMLLVAKANELVLLFFALELVSIPTYAMVAASTQTPASQEAGLKYFFLGAMTSAMMVYGFSFLYGAAGTTAMFAGADSHSIAAVVQQAWREQQGLGGGGNLTVWLGLVLALLGLAYKVAAVPMHFYVADVYQGAASPVAGFLSFVPKFAGLVAMMKVLAMVGWPLGERAPLLYWLVWIMAAATMTVGNTLALLQDNVKRMLAYSSVAHSGYMLMGLLVGLPYVLTGDGFNPVSDGLAAVLFYIVAYGAMNIGAFAVIAYLTDGGREPQLVQTLTGFGRDRPGAGLAMAVCVFSLLGMPPTIGFFGKVYLFGSTFSLAESTGHETMTIILAVIALLNTGIGAGYYLKIIGTAYLRPSEQPFWRTAGQGVGLGVALCALSVMVFGIRSGWLAGPALLASHEVTALTPRKMPPIEPPERVFTAGETFEQTAVADGR